MFLGSKASGPRLRAWSFGDLTLAVAFLRYFGLVRFFTCREARAGLPGEGRSSETLFAKVAIPSRKRAKGKGRKGDPGSLEQSWCVLEAIRK